MRILRNIALFTLFMVFGGMFIGLTAFPPVLTFASNPVTVKSISELKTAIDNSNSSKPTDIIIDGSIEDNTAIPIADGKGINIISGELIRSGIGITVSGKLMLSGSAKFTFVDGAVIQILNGELIMNGGVIESDRCQSCSVIWVISKYPQRTGSFTMNGGTIRILGNNSYKGGAVDVNESGVFTMNGGSIITTTSMDQRAVLYSSDEDFKHYGGTITGKILKNYNEQYGITFHKNNNSAKGKMPVQYGDPDTNVTLSANAFSLDGHSFEGWSMTENGPKKYDNESRITLDSHKNLYAVWSPPPTYDVTVENDGHGSASASPSNAWAGAVINLTAVSNKGYKFKEWSSKDGIIFSPSDNAATSFTMIDRNVTVKANFEKDDDPTTYTITFDPNDGTVSPKSAKTGEDGKLSSLPTPTRDGYDFTGWFTAKTDGNEVTTSTVFSSDTTVYAHWKESDTTTETPISVSDNKPMNLSTEIRGDFRITYAHDIPFFGNSKITPDYFGGITVSNNNSTYMASAIKVNRKKHLMQITALEGNDKQINKAIKKATKGKNGLPFNTNPYFVRNTDDVVIKEKKDGSAKSVKVKINDKYYKAKKDREWKYDKETKTVTFSGDNLDGSFTRP